MQHAPDSSRRRSLRALLSFPVVALGGCVAAPYGTHYRPATAQPGARERRAWCSGQAGPVTGLDIDLGAGVQLQASSEQSASGVALRLAVTVPPATALRFEGEPLVRVAGRSQPVPLAARAVRTLTVDPSGWIDPALLRPGLAGDGDAPHGRLAVVMRTTATPAPQRFAVQGLALVREGGATPMGGATLERVSARSRIATYRSAQQQAALQERVERCRRETPRLACQNILDFADAGHSAQSAAARWDWRWRELPQAGSATLEGELRLAVLEPGRWRLASEGLELRDTDSGAAHALRLGNATLTFSDRVDLQRGVTRAPAATRLLFDATLPADVPDFELVLQPMLRDEARLAIAPVRFERRAFDGGVQPFNC